MTEPCPSLCESQAAAQLLGPLRPNATICAHGVRRTLDDVFPPSEPDYEPDFSGYDADYEADQAALQYERTVLGRDFREV